MPLIFNKPLVIGQEDWTLSPFRFFRKDFILNGSGSSEPTWKDIILHGNTALTLVNSKANGLNYLKLFGNTEQLAETYIDSVTLEGKCEQNGTPTPTSPVNIVCNNGAIKFSPNELNPSDIVIGYYRTSATGALTESPCNFVTGYMPVEPNKSYVFFGRRIADNKLSSYNRIHWFDANKEYVSTNTYTKDNVGTGIAPSNAYFAQCSCNESGDSTTKTTQQIVDGYNWVFELATAEVPYIPYVEGGLYTDGTVETATDNVGNVATAEMLLSVGDYTDTQEVLSGVVTRNLGIKVLDGTEDGWTKSNNSFSNTYICPDKIDAKKPMLCTHFVYNTGTTTTITDLKIGCSVNGTNVFFRYDTISTVEDWQTWLVSQYTNGTPVIVVYPLATATTETVSGQVLNKEPLTVTGALNDLVVTPVTSSHTTPTPSQPLDILCNNGVIKYGQYGKNLFDKTLFNTDVGSTIIYTTFEISNGTYTMSTNFPNDSNLTNVFIFAGEVTSGAATTTNGVYDGQSRTITVTDGKYTVAYRSRTSTSSNTNNPKDYDFQLELGSTATPYEPYHFGVHADGTTETVEVTGKNLLNESENVISRGVSSTGTEISVSATFAHTTFIPVLPNTTYTMSGLGNVSVALSKRGAEYSDNNFSSYVKSIERSSDTFTTSATTKFVCLNVLSAETQQQVELGSTATTYEPYFNGGTATAEMLLKVGGYQDVQSVLDGVVTRNVGVLVLDGVTTGKMFSSAWNATYKRCNLTIPDMLISVAATEDAICNLFPYSSSVNTSPTSLGFCTNNGYLLVSFIGMENITSANDANAWLAQQYNSGNPVIVLYPKSTATTETVTAQPLTIQAGTNVVEITQASMENLELEVSYKAGVEVTVTEIENAQLDNSVEVTVNG